MLCRLPPAWIATALLVAVATPVAAQQPLRITPHDTATEAPADKQGREKELQKLRAEQRKAAESETRLKAEIETIGQDRRKLGQALIDTASRLRDHEARIAEAESRMASLGENEAAVRKALQGRRATMAELLAVLQRMGRKPPPALLVRPEHALDAVRSAILLGALVPELRLEAKTLADELTALLRVRREIAVEREGLDRDRAVLEQEQTRMAALIDERQRRQVEAEKALDSERQRALALGRQAQDLQDLIAKLEQEGGTRRQAPAESRGEPAPPGEAPRLAPAVAFAQARGTLRLPVNGIKVRAFGASDGLGGVQRGLSIATRAGSQVTAPSDAWVVYAGPFRSYGQLLILNAGGGYHILLAGMERISVGLGQFVLTGEPVASMGGGPKSAAAVVIGSSQPTLYIEFRKDGSPVDPSPWWATTDSEKVRG